MPYQPCKINLGMSKMRFVISHISMIDMFILVFFFPLHLVLWECGKLFIVVQE